MKRIVALTLIGVVLLGMLGGCGSGEEAYVPTGNALSQGEESRPSAEETVQTTSLPYAPQKGLNPHHCSDYTNKVVFSLVYQGLFAVDQSSKVWPILCDTYQVSWDMKTYTFRLVQATFSDGSPLTAADVIASLEAARKSPVYAGRFHYVDTIGVAEDGAVQITLTTPYENLPLLLDVPILKSGQVNDPNPVGTGPYTYEKQGNGLGLRRYPGWWCDAPIAVNAERITLLEAQSAAQLRDAFEFEDLSLVCTDPGSDSYVDFHSDHELWDSESGVFLYLACNDKSQVFSMPIFRQALLLAVNRSMLAESYYRDFAYPTVLPASPKSPFYSEALAGSYGYEPQRMNLAVADHPEVREMPVVLLVNGGDPVRVRAARAIAKDLCTAGLKVTTSELTGTAYRTALETDAFDLHLGQTKLSANMDLSAFFQEDGALGYGGLEDPIVHALCLETLANAGNYYTLYQKILEDGQLCPILFRSYAIYIQRGSFPELQPARDNLFFYHLGKTVEESLVES